MLLSILSLVVLTSFVMIYHIQKALNPKKSYICMAILSIISLSLFSVDCLTPIQIWNFHQTPALIIIPISGIYISCVFAVIHKYDRIFHAIMSIIFLLVLFSLGMQI